MNTNLNEQLKAPSQPAQAGKEDSSRTKYQSITGLTHALAEDSFVDQVAAPDNHQAPRTSWITSRTTLQKHCTQSIVHDHNKIEISHFT